MSLQMSADIQQKLVDRIKLDEGFKSRPYVDTTGHLTIGYGFNLDSGFTQDECELLLNYRLGKLEKELIAVWPDYQRQDDVRKSVLLALSYNLGVGGLMTFKVMLGYVQNKEYTAAADDLEKSYAAKQEPARMERWSYQMRNGMWQ